MFDLTIIGGGPAGVAAGVYAARKKLITAFVTPEWGGQSTVSDDIQNWIGTPHISGNALAQSLKAHLTEYAGDVVKIYTPHFVTHVTKCADGTFQTTLKDGTVIDSRAVLLTVGSSRKKLPAKNADVFEHRGVTYCASCDGPLFTDQDVLVVGGGNAGFESAAQLLAYCKSVTLINRTETFRADPVTVEKVLAHPNMKTLMSSEIVEVVGDGLVSSVIVKNLKTGAESTLETAGVFVEIGAVPNTSIVADIVELTEFNTVKIDPWTQRTSVPGIWAAGDCTNGKYHQNNIAAGDAVKALEDIYITLKTS